MIELGTGQKPAATATDLIKEGSDATFVPDVIEASQTVPVIVDFYQPQLGSTDPFEADLDAAVAKADGRIKLVRIDVTRHQQIAQQLQIQSVPTVYAFFEGKPVDAFQGAMAPSELAAFIEKTAGLGGEPDNGLADALEAAETMLAEGEAADAAETFAAILEEDPDNAAAFGGLARAHLAQGQVDQAEAVLNGAPAALATKPEIEAVHAQIDLARQAQNAGPVDALRAAVDATPDDHRARFDLATALHASGDVQGAVDQLLELFRRDREWNEQAAKIQLFKIFDALTPQDPIAHNGRRKLSSMIFA